MRNKARKSASTSRRSALKGAVSAAMLPLVHIRSAGAAGKLSLAFTDSFIPVDNVVTKRQVEAWASKNAVDVQVDFITVIGNKLLLTGAAEALAHAGHDMYTFYSWDLYNQHAALAPVDDVMAPLLKAYGPVDQTAEYLGKSNGHWVAVPTSSGTQVKPPCARISWFRKHGLDLEAMYPAKAEHTALQDSWNYETFLKFAELAQKDGVTFGLGIGGSNNTDGIDQVGAMFHAFGANLVDEKGQVTLDTPEMQECLEYAAKLVKFLPDDAVSYDDASNNRALVSGKSALIFNAPSAWWVAKRDAPAIAEDCWTFSAPQGPKGRFVPSETFFWGIWSFSRNQSAAKELLLHLMQKDQVEERINAVQGYNIPPFAGLRNIPVWDTVGPPPGTLFNYPIRPWHNAQPSLPGSEAPPDIAAQIYANAIHTGMLSRLKSGSSIKQVTAWANDQLGELVR